MAKVPVYHEGRIVGRVEYNDRLDVWDGRNWQNGGTGLHLGITRLKKPIDGKSFVLIDGTNWEGQRDTARLVDDDVALQAIIAAGKEDLLEKYFPDHKADLDEVEI